MKRRQLIHDLQSSKQRRRKLRRNTPAETYLWHSLRRSQLDGKKFRRQHGIGPYIVDFYCPECRVIVELDGAGHFDPLGLKKDDERSRFLSRFGVQVIRFENKQVLRDRESVLEAIRSVLADRA